jgi:hypothetical protein
MHGRSRDGILSRSPVTGKNILFMMDSRLRASPRHGGAVRMCLEF